MKVINIHKRIILQPKEKLSSVLDSLSSKNDQLWPYENWPPMVFENGLQEGAIGGHGPIEYSVKKYIPGSIIEFEFIKPEDFVGIHKFEIEAIDKEKTQLIHTIRMAVSGKGILIWYIAIKWLHDALLEDCLDKAENQFLNEKKKTKWNFWVLILKKILKKK
jgi:hypothetical protein